LVLTDNFQFFVEVFLLFLLFGLKPLEGLNALELKFVGEVDGGLLDEFVEQV
jgi:hypothetical protein